ncbi:MAG: PadR family transcriptional regulator [Candidatus Micrarchaeia archaeon]|jgi:DNA-binding PadR family transcriptional regulator
MKGREGGAKLGGKKVKRLFGSMKHTPPMPILTLFFIWRLHSEPRHGYSLIKDLREIATTPAKPSTIYALLAKLEETGMIKSRLDNKGAHVRKLYQTTAQGWSLLQEVKKRKMRGLWREFICELIA